MLRRLMEILRGNPNDLEKSSEDKHLQQIRERLEKTDDWEYKRFVEIRDILFREQEFFWLSFAAFAALHAGLWALLDPCSVDLGRIRSFGIFLASLWVLSQLFGEFYVSRHKRQYYPLAKVLMKIDIDHFFEGRLPFLSTRLLAIFVSLAVLAFWVLFANDKYISCAE